MCALIWSNEHKNTETNPYNIWTPIYSTIIQFEFKCIQTSKSLYTKIERLYFQRWHLTAVNECIIFEQCEVRPKKLCIHGIAVAVCILMCYMSHFQINISQWVKCNKMHTIIIRGGRNCISKRYVCVCVWSIILVFFFISSCHMPINLYKFHGTHFFHIWSHRELKCKREWMKLKSMSAWSDENVQIFLSIHAIEM